MLKYCCLLLLLSPPGIASAQQERSVRNDPASAKGHQEQGNAVRVFLRIRHVRQKARLCAPASASMALSHYGVAMDQSQIKQLAASVSNKPDFPGTYYVDLVNGLKLRGISWKRNPHPTTPQGFSAGLETIRDSLKAGQPVIIDTFLAPNGHTMLVNGIDTHRQLVSVIDPNRPSPGLRTFTFAEFERIWRSKTADVRGSILTFPPGTNDKSATTDGAATN